MDTLEELMDLIADADPDESISWPTVRTIAIHLINSGVRIAAPEGEA